MSARPIYFGVFLFVLLALLGLGSIFLPNLSFKSLPIPAEIPQIFSEKIPSESLKEIEYDCRASVENKFAGKIIKPAASALNDLDGSRLQMGGMIQWFRDNGMFAGSDIGNIFGEKPKDIMIQETRDFLQNSAQAKKELLKCYVDNLKNYPQTQKYYQDLLDKQNQALSEISRMDFTQFFTSDTLPQSVFEIGAKERKSFRLRTFCLDSFAGPPQYNALYLPGGSTDDLQKPFCQKLRQGQTNKDLTQAQNEIWDLDRTTKRADVSASQPLAQSMSLADAYQKGLIGFRARSTGTITSFDVVMTNFTDRSLTIDLSCVYLVPATFPISVILKKQSLSNVLGMGSYIGSGNICNTNMKDVESSHPAQAGFGMQTVGSVGNIGKTMPQADELPPLEPIPPNDNRTIAERNLDDAWDKYLEMPSADNLDNLLESLEACKVLGCKQANQIQKELEKFITELADENMGKYQTNLESENLIDAVDSVNLADGLGQDTGKYNQQLNDILAKQVEKIQRDPEQCP